MPNQDRFVVPAEGKSVSTRKYRKKWEPEDKPLNRREELFVKELVSKDGQITLREAAVNAGYPVKSAHVRASELTNPNACPHVVKAIRKYRNELDEKYGVMYKRHLRDLQIIRDAAMEKGAFSAAVQAEYRRGQAQGDIYVNKSEIRHGTIDSMSKEEVLKAIKELKQFEPVTIDVTPETTEDETKQTRRAKKRGRILGTVEEPIETKPQEVDGNES